jgi:hypothetical protein
VDHAAVRPDSRRAFVAPRDDLPLVRAALADALRSAGRDSPQVQRDGRQVNARILGVAMKKATRAMPDYEERRARQAPTRSLASTTRTRTASATPGSSGSRPKGRSRTPLTRAS